MTKKKVPVKAVVKAKPKPVDPLYETRRKYPVDSIWLHNKTGRRMIVLDHALLEAEGYNDRQALVYAEVGKETDCTYVRPVEEWDQEIEIKITRPRFEILSKQ